MIRNFIYLDSDKLRSISSQLFEGVTEQVVRQSGTSDTRDTTQKGPVNSGRLVADIFAKENSSSELRFLEDHAFTLLEDKLITDGAVDIREGTYSEGIEKRFVKVTGTLSVNDMAVTSATLRSFNTIGEAQWRATNENPNNPKSLPDADAKKKAAEIGLQMNKKWSDAVAYLTDFGFEGLLEFHIAAGTTLFSAPIKRHFLRESERMLLHKYSRTSQYPFSILGIVTQSHKADLEQADLPNVGDAGSIKGAMRTLAMHLRNVEQTFAGPVEDEIIIDPIAVYSLL